MMIEIQHNIIRYSQKSIEATFHDRRTPVNAWADALPYNVPLEVADVGGEYLSLDNRRLFSAKNYSRQETVQCVVYQLAGAPTELMRDHGLDQLEIIWIDEQNRLNRLCLRAITTQGVMTIRCATQDSSFSILGQLEDPSVGSRIYDSHLAKIVPPDIKFAVVDDKYQESLRAATTVYVRIISGRNVYHKRDDLCNLILSGDDIFRVERYERCNLDFTLKARGAREPDVWDDWDELLVSLFEAESCARDEYEYELYKA